LLTGTGLPGVKTGYSPAVAGDPREHALPAASPGQFRQMLAGAIGNSLEWYDFAAYGYFAAIFGRNFFPSSDAVVSLASAFGVFAAAFLMRPIGGALFGHVGDRFGRKRALVLSAGLMTVATVAIGLLPTYAMIGPAAPFLLLGLRLLQGLSVGGEFATSYSWSSAAVRGGAACSAASPVWAPLAARCWAPAWGCSSPRCSIRRRWRPGAGGSPSSSASPWAARLSSSGA
jgi:MFS family permease